MGIKDFDFLIGEWRVRHRRLKERLANSRDWVEFDGTCVTRKVLGGCGNIDEHFLDLPGDAYHALAVRTCDPATKRWSIWWIDGRSPSELDPPLVGDFKDGVGTFYADQVFRGKPIRVRFLWTDLETRPRWEQAFSTDDGPTWKLTGRWTSSACHDHGTSLLSHRRMAAIHAALG
jgi:hypothetical protein